MKTLPTRIDADVFDAAKTVAGTMSRSAAQQVNHWARIGRELELSASMRHHDVVQVLAGAAPYDSLDSHAQALVRAEWDERMTHVRSQLDLGAELTAAGRSWTEVDDDGNLVVKNGEAKP